MVDTYPSELIDNIKKNRNIFFVGAGISMELGLPSWSKLIEELIELLSKQSWSEQSKIDEYRELLKKDNTFLLLVEDLKTELGNQYYDFMDAKFGKPDIGSSQTMMTILELKPSIVITSNYDRIIENTYTKLHGYAPPTFTYRQSREIANNFWKEKFFVLKAHGDAFEDVKGIILSQRDYRKTLFREFGYKSILQSIFSTKSVFFVGTSMTDPEFNLLLDYIHESYSGGGPTHYLLIEEEKALPTYQRRFLEDYRIQVLTYKNHSGKHDEVNQYLTDLKKLI